MAIRGKVPLERAISKMGVASRSEARTWILAGQVTVNGAVRRDPELLIEPGDEIRHGRGRIRKVETRVALFHKPRGVVTTRSDEKGRPTIYSLLPGDDQNLHAVGRLDMATSGLLILTNHTILSAWLADPTQAIPRTYIATVRGRIKPEELERMRAGIEDKGEMLSAKEVVLRKTSNRESHLTMILTEGKNREIRRLFTALGHEVTRLKRVAFGPFQLGNLRPGEIRETPITEVRKAFPGAPL